MGDQKILRFQDNLDQYLLQKDNTHRQNVCRIGNHSISEIKIDAGLIHKLDTANTPSYPSGHATEGALIAEVLSSLYPEHKSKFYEFAGLVARARVLQGVHYTRDGEASMMLARICWENIKSNLEESKNV